MRPLVAAMGSPDAAVAQYAAGAIANLAIGDFQGSVVRAGGIAALLVLARSSSLEVQEQALRGLHWLHQWRHGGRIEDVGEDGVVSGCHPGWRRRWRFMASNSLWPSNSLDSLAS